jgi:hypothetical protein
MKLSLDALKERAEAVASEVLLSEISGGTQDDCHPKVPVADQRIA